MVNGGRGQRHDLQLVSPTGPSQAPPLLHIWFDHLHPEPLLATPACTSSILGVIVTTALAGAAKVSHDVKT